VSRLQSDKKNLEEDLTEAEANLEAERENGRKQKRKYEGQLGELTADLERSSKNTASSEEIRKLEDQVEELSVKLRAAEVAKDEAEKDARQAAAENTDYKQQIEEADRNNAKLTNEVRKLRAELEGAKEGAESFEESKATSEANSRRLQAEVDELKRKLAKETDGRVRAEDGRSALERDFKNLKKDLDALERKNAAGDRETRDVRAKHDDLRYQLSNEERARNKQLDTIRDLRKLLLEREQANKELIEKVYAANDDDRRGLESEVTSLKAKNEGLHERVSSLQNDFDSLFRKLEDRKEGSPAAQEEEQVAKD